MDLPSIRDELYELHPQDFTAARNERVAAARSAGDRELAEQIRALRRPTVSAWAGNLLVRREPERIRPLIGLGEALRAAHRDLDGDQLRELSRQQHLLVAALAREARDLAAAEGQQLGEAALREIEGTLHAVLADPDAAEEWSAGHLDRPLTAPVGFTAAGAGPGAVPQPSGTGRKDGRGSRPQAQDGTTRSDRGADGRRATDGRRERERLRKLEEARGEADDAERRARELDEEAERTAAAGENVKAQERAAVEHVDTLADELKQARLDLRAARKAAREADDRAREARAEAETAHRRARQASQRAERLVSGEG